ERRGLVQSTWQQVSRQRRRCYQLTEQGRQILSEQLAQWDQFLGATDRVIDS
ncbi:MAG: PadR family transcriptional regulator, partial [Dehalococcoidia bacterium]